MTSKYLGTWALDKELQERYLYGIFDAFLLCYQQKHCYIQWLAVPTNRDIEL